MNRRALLLPLLLAGCGLSERPYLERRQWPLVGGRPGVLAGRKGGKVIEVRTLRAGPGLDARGLQTLAADGSVAADFYEEWSVPPAQGVEELLRGWLRDSGLFAGVVAPGSRVPADLVLEGELGALWSETAGRRARATLGITLIAAQGDAARVLLQRRYEATAAQGDDTPGGRVQAMLAAVTVVLARLEADLRQLAA